MLAAMTREEKAAALRQLHRRPELLVLPNAWDAASARVFADAGFAAIATSSGAIATSHGFPDGEHIPRELMLDAVRRIVHAVDLPVSADLEAGYGDPVGTARAAWELGAVGMNLEDRCGTPEEHAAALRDVRAAVPELVLNARVDVLLRGGGDVADAVARANAYLEAGADCAFVIGALDLETIQRLAAEIDGPLNVFFPPESAPLEELRAFGVRRLTFGSGFHRASVARVNELALELAGS
jgi:2-methylisocitrate lyase-like PEP mutase family enzyme